MKIQTPYHCTCFECEAKDIAQTFQDYDDKKRTLTRLAIGNVYEQSLIVPVHGIYLERSVLIWNPKGKDYCALVASCTDGFDAQTYRINHRCQIIVTGYSALDGYYPFYHFFRYEPEGLRRYVRTMKDDPRWEFYQEGEPFEFEDVSRYSRRLKRERLDRDMVIEYMRQMGYDLEDPSFYETDECYLVEGI